MMLYIYIYIVVIVSSYSISNIILTHIPFIIFLSNAFFVTYLPFEPGQFLAATDAPFRILAADEPLTSVLRCFAPLYCICLRSSFLFIFLLVSMSASTKTWWWQQMPFVVICPWLIRISIIWTVPNLNIYNKVTLLVTAVGSILHLWSPATSLTVFSCDSQLRLFSN